MSMGRRAGLPRLVAGGHPYQVVGANIQGCGQGAKGRNRWLEGTTLKARHGFVGESGRLGKGSLGKASALPRLKNSLGKNLAKIALGHDRTLAASPFMDSLAASSRAARTPARRVSRLDWRATAPRLHDYPGRAGSGILTT